MLCCCCLGGGGGGGGGEGEVCFNGLRVVQLRQYSHLPVSYKYIHYIPFVNNR